MTRLTTAAALLAATSAGAAAPPATEKLDAILKKAWADAGVRPAGRVDDAGFLRRASLDLTGRLPEPDRVRRFLADADPDKRSRLIDELLKSDAYATRWADYWNAVLMGRLIRSAVVHTDKFHAWLKGQFAENRPWDEFARELVAAEGYSSDKAPRRRAGRTPGDMAERYNPATNWFLRYYQSMPEFGAKVSKTFLGVQIQCAQCHDHKTEKWTQDDFRSFTANFSRTWPRFIDRPNVVGRLRAEVKDWRFAPPTFGRLKQVFGSYEEYKNVEPRLLDGTEVSKYGSRRKRLAGWMTADDNPWFAEAAVNRYWAELTGTGFVEPMDDFRPGNPAALPAALELLAADFKEHDYDLHHLLRVVCNSEAYQRAGRPSDDTQARHPLWSSFPLKQPSVEVMFDVFQQATGTAGYLKRMARGRGDLIRTAFIRQFVSQMSVDEESETTADSGGTVQHALMRLNGAFLNGGSRDAAGLTLDKVMKRHRDDKSRVRELYLATLSREPSAEELSHWVKFVNAPRRLADAAGSAAAPLTGLAAMRVNPELKNAPADADFSALVERAKTAADFRYLAGKIENNADAGVLAKAFEVYAAEVPFRHLARREGARTPKGQAYEDLFWALLNTTEFLTNH